MSFYQCFNLVVLCRIPLKRVMLFEELSPLARELACESMEWMDGFWDEEAGLLAIGADFATAKRNVRNTARYALGLLLRNAAGDRMRACKALEAVLSEQYDEPGSALHGSFRSWANQGHPGPEPTIFQFDPNHRQFLGTLFAMLLDHFASSLPADLTERIDLAIRRMVEGEPPHRCLPVYSNIALMHAALLTWAGVRYVRPDWVLQGEALGSEVHRLFAGQNAFEEYNSPTYYGTDIFALAFWQRHSRSKLLERLGREIEPHVWRDTAQYYHAGLKNMCGPYTRSYGMDMTSYCSLLGMSVWLGAGRADAPFPPTTREVFDHCEDFCWGPCMAILDTRIPSELLPLFTKFPGEHFIERRISVQPDRVATAWLDESIMIGAEATPLDAGEMTFYRLREDFEEFNPASHHWKNLPLATKRCAMISRDFCPATIHWREPNGKTAWMRLQHLGAIRARADRGKLSIAGQIEPHLLNRYGEAHSSFVFRIRVSQSEVSISPKCWKLPGLSLAVSGNLDAPSVVQEGSEVLVTFTPKTDRPEIHFELLPDS